MAFNSLQFLAFLPAVIGGYFLVPARARWVWLLAASAYFYCAFSVWFALHIAAVIAACYYLGLRIEAVSDKPRKKRVLTVGVLLLVANLFGFKYTVFANETARSAMDWLGLSYPVPVFQVLLPVGISFYTFQLISYLVDVYNGRVRAERHLGIFALYVSFFPKVVSGPIERAKNLLPQLHDLKGFDDRQVVLGAQLLAWGFFKKVVVGDRLAPIVQQVYAEPQAYDGVAMATATLLFAFQIYCDFSGYTDIARGAAQMMGFRLMNNFNRPYFAISIQDFWKRWHISLTTWLTDYVYTPLTRSRIIKMKWYYLMLLSLFLTFVVSGLWHGAQWTFVAWGALHGLYLVCSMLTQRWRRTAIKRFRLDRVPRLHHALRMAMTFGLVCFGYILFQASSMSDALYIMTHLHTGWAEAPSSLRALAGQRWPGLMFAAYGLAMVLAVDILQSRGPIREMLAARPAWVRWGLYYGHAISFVLFGAFYETDAQQFIYFQF